MNADSQQLPGVQILGARDKQTDEILTPEALNFIVDLERRFGPSAASCWPPVWSGKQNSMQARARTFCRRPLKFARATGRLLRCQRICWTGVSRSPDQSIAKWLSTP